MFTGQIFMKAQSFSLLMSLAVCFSAEAAPYARFNNATCNIGQYANVGKYLGKSYKTLPKEILDAGSDFGNVEHHTFWEGYESTLKYFNLPGKDVEGIFFDVYKEQIVSVGIYFSDQSIASGVVDINQVMNACGKRIDQYCSVHNKDVELIIPNKNTLTIQYSKAMAQMYGFPLKYSYPCALTLNHAPKKISAEPENEPPLSFSYRFEH
jgi:hypothetical protein